ncbi:unnamed protein product [Paramecium pentaurelia]|uniref:Protein transport protein SEC23 n=1 Tax=Paramecium pentaurelia TaxID=43138 RepID=A0A8S1S7D2_9CILI|nr:unnamed protein product [Paramecium pentaurelia]
MQQPQGQQQQIQPIDFYQEEYKDGVRLSWNTLPATKLQSTRAIVPIGCLYTPMKDLESLVLVQYSPLYCKCGAVLNPYNQIDFRNKQWTCVFCTSKNMFPKHYADHITETQLPAELKKTSTTIEYILANQQAAPTTFLYIIDTCIPQEDLQAIRDSIQQSLSIIPPDSLVGLITFGRNVFIHELGFQECPKCYSFKGSKDYTTQQILEMLQVSTKPEILKRFLVPLSECEFSFNSILDDLQCDPWTTQPGEREVRANGSALKIGSTLVESATQFSKILFFVGGPCTIGPGQVVGLKLEETIRSYLDIQKENPNTQYLQKAKKFYNEIAQRAIKANMTVDIFAFTLDQFGLLEMKQLAEKTGGVVVMQEKFDSDMFRETYKKLFDKDSSGFLKMGFGSKMDIFVSKDIKVQGGVGPCISLKKGGPMVSEVSLGEGGTTSWYTGGLDRNSTILLMFDLSSTKDTNFSQYAYIQFVTIYRHSSRLQRLRVTTIQRRFADHNNIMDMIRGFDQEAACVTMARVGILKAEQEESIEVLKWLDRSLIRVVARFGSYRKDDVSSFRFPQEMMMYPQFMYHLRRSHFITTFGASPDETTFYRASLSRESVQNALVMIQPALLQYTIDDPVANAVNLDIQSMKPDVVLLLDTYFNVVVWNGENVQKWIEEGYYDNPEYEYVKELIDSPNSDVQYILEDRFPVPKLIKTYFGHGQERYLKSRVNPSVNTVQNENVESGNYITDDASLKVFTDHLIRLAVQTVQ